MELIIGGAYQGKRGWAAKAYGLKETEIFLCTRETEIDFSCRCIAGLENYVWYVMYGAGREDGQSPDGTEAARADAQDDALPGPLRESLTRFRPDAVLICSEIFGGVVPMEDKVRAWRETAGHYLAALAREAAHVTRIYCGLPERLK